MNSFLFLFFVPIIGTVQSSTIKKRCFCPSVCLSAVETYGTQTEEVQPGPQRGTPKTGANRTQPTDNHGNEKLSLGPHWNGTARIRRNEKKGSKDRPQPTKNVKKMTTTHTPDRASLRRVASQPRRPGVSSQKIQKNSETTSTP